MILFQGKNRLFQMLEILDNWAGWRSNRIYRGYKLGPGGPEAVGSDPRNTFRKESRKDFCHCLAYQMWPFFEVANVARRSRN